MSKCADCDGPVGISADLLALAQKLAEVLGEDVERVGLCDYCAGRRKRQKGREHRYTLEGAKNGDPFTDW